MVDPAAPASQCLLVSDLPPHHQHNVGEDDEVHEHDEDNGEAEEQAAVARLPVHPAVQVLPTLSETGKGGIIYCSSI